MLTVLIETTNEEEALARTLASLVGGAVDGTIREVIVCDHNSTDGTRSVADHSGCTFLSNSDLAKGVALARSEWLLVLQPGARLLEGWTVEARDHTAHGKAPARFRRSRSSRGSWLACLLHRGGLGEGLLILKAQAQSGRQLASFGAGAKRLDAEIVAVG